MCMCMQMKMFVRVGVFEYLLRIPKNVIIYKTLCNIFLGLHAKKKKKKKKKRERNGWQQNFVHCEF